MSDAGRVPDGVDITRAESPATGNTHEVVLKVAPDARVVYVDHDPMVAAMAEGLIADPESAKEMYRRSAERLYPRPKAVIESLFEGLELVGPYPGAGPDLCFVGTWGADYPEAADSDGSRIMYCGVARGP